MIKRLLFLAVTLICTVNLWAQAVTITNAAGWLESAFVEWQPIENADSYKVYYTGEGVTDRVIDTQLVRDYGDYFRADVLGLKAGSYTLKVVPVIDGNEGASAQTATLQVASYDRTGFAFVNGRVPGAYKADGTPKENAVILYITENSKNSISMDVTGANANPCVGLQTILEGFKKGRDTRPLIVRFVGQITDLEVMDKGDIVVENNRNAASYITLEGVGEDAVIDGWGIRIKSASNVEIRNLATMNCDSNEGDNISLQQDNDYIWVHHNDFFYGQAGSASDQVKGDGALDCKRSTYITFSYNHFWDAGKAALLGLNENTTEGLFITYHHNWFDHSDSRHPRVRFYSAHVYNNYYDGNSKYGVGSTNGSSVFVEKNYFRNCKNPMMISMQGTDTKMGADENNAPTFSKENGGIIKAFDNHITGNATFAPYSVSNTIHFDAYVTATREEQVPSTVTAKKGGGRYNNFDTNAAVMYEYKAHETNEVVEVVTKFAGRMNGGDFKWSFNNAVDDTSYDVIPELKAKLMNYKTTLVAVQGDVANDGSNDGDEDGEGDNENDGGSIDADIVHNFTTQGVTSAFFEITGNLDSKPSSVTYQGLTLTRPLKLESSTAIRFTLSRAGKMTLVLSQGSTNSIKINGANYAAVNGLVTVDLAAGDHLIQRVQTESLYLISIELEEVSTGIESAQLSTLKLYPNPVVDRIFIPESLTVELVELFNLAGSLVLRSAGNLHTIHVNHLPNGVYLVRVRAQEGTILQRIIKK